MTVSPRNILTLDQKEKADDSKLLLKIGYPHRVTVKSGAPFICKVYLEGRQPPLTFKVKYVTQGDLQVYGSYFNKLPNAQMSDFS